ncbi:MAG: hypothetical protein QN162_09980 [Armatimonadota bacterium]|nr:hypothetical protein [Armatimonadota bacterium]
MPRNRPRAFRIPDAMQTLRAAAVDRYRRGLLRRYRIRTRRQALRFIEALGFCYAFTAGPGAIPGLFDVLATRSSDRMWTWAWQWKDELVARREVHYGKVLRRKPAYVSLALLPAFYALSGNVGEPDDHLQHFREGRLSLLARALYEAILADGPLSTWALRRRFVARAESGTRFHRALDDLQALFLIAKVGEEEQWRGGFRWDAFHRWQPGAVRAAARLSAEDAAARILDRYVRIVGAATPPAIAQAFGWTPGLVERAAARVRLAPVVVDGQPCWTQQELWGQ